jgi:MFS family permease
MPWVTGPMSTFARDKYTWTTYAVFALLGFVQSSLGPILPTLREELGFSYAVRGLHLSTFALGALLASLAAPRAVGALDLRRVLWLSVCGMAGGCLLLAAAPSATVTLFATGVIGVFTAWIVGAVQALLSAHHGANWTAALVEVDVAASLGAFVVPLAVAAAQWVIGVALIAYSATGSRLLSLGERKRIGPLVRCSLRTTCDSAGRSRADACFVLSEHAPHGGRRRAAGMGV